MTRQALGSVVVPAHDEQAVIGRCLEALLTGVEPGVLDVVVVCNGCSDRTAEVARGYEPAVRVLDLDVASKAAALRAGDQAASTFPRLYLDADVVVPGASVVRVLEGLRYGPALAGRPPASWDTRASSRLVRRYFKARLELVTTTTALWGAGAYALSAAGRERFGEFPDLVADDLYVDQLFERSELELFDCAPVVVTAPRRAHDLLLVLRRAQRGKDELHTAAVPSTTTAVLRELGALVRRRPTALPDVLVYLGIAVVSRLPQSGRTSPRWERDESSRVAPGPP